MYSPKIRIPKKSAGSGRRAVKAVKGELHNVLSLMRRGQSASSSSRFTREIPSQEENNQLRRFKETHESFHSIEDLNDVSALVYLSPFLDAIKESGPLTAISIAAVNKFLLYGILNRDSNDIRRAINGVADAVISCTHNMAEIVSMKILELMVHCVRSDCGPLLTDGSVWKLFESCYKISRHWDTSALLRHTAENTLAHIVLTIFSRVTEFVEVAEVERAKIPVMGGGFGTNVIESPKLSSLTPLETFTPLQSTPSDVALLEADDDFISVPNKNIDDTMPPVVPVQVKPPQNVERSESCKEFPPYEVGVLLKVLSFLTSLTQPNVNDEDARILSLSLINILLETAGDSLSDFPSLVEVLRCDMCKYLLQNSQTEELPILSLTLRVVYNLFNSIKSHLKVQLEVFFISVHLRIADNENASNEMKELALESLLDFCLEPAMMHDLFINYDCDVQCTNLFEDLCKCLCRNATAKDGKLNALQLVAIDGLLAVLKSMALRCDLKSTTPKKRSQLGVDTKTFIKKSTTESATQIALRKKHKQNIATAVSVFNRKPKLFVKKAVELGLFTDPNPSPADVAAFFYQSPQGLDPKVLGEYLSEPPDKYPFNVAVLQQFSLLFDFKGLDFVEAMRMFLSSFRLPGEAQKIDRLMEALASRIFMFCPGPLANSDAAFVLAFSTIMLNTDLHNPQVDKKMTIEDFVRNNRGTNDGGDLPIEFQSAIYNAIKEKPFDLVPGPVASRSVVPSDTEHWNGLMRRSQALKGFEATDEGVGLLRAGVHEREMFLPIASSAKASLFAIFENTSDISTVRKTLVGIGHFAAIAAYFQQQDLVNEVIISLANFFIRYTEDLSNVIVKKSAYERAQGPKTAEVMEHRTLLALQEVFHLVRNVGNYVREGWRSIVACILRLLHLDVLPHALMPRVDRHQETRRRRSKIDTNNRRQSLGGKDAGHDNGWGWESLLYDGTNENDGGLTGLFASFMWAETDEIEPGFWGWHPDSYKETKKLSELGALRAKVCQLDITSVFSDSTALNDASLTALMENIVLAGDIRSAHQIARECGQNLTDGKSRATVKNLIRSVKASVTCTKLLSLITAANAHRIPLVLNFVKTNLERLIQLERSMANDPNTPLFKLNPIEKNDTSQADNSKPDGLLNDSRGKEIVETAAVAPMKSKAFSAMYGDALAFAVCEFLSLCSSSLGTVSNGSTLVLPVIEVLEQLPLQVIQLFANTIIEGLLGAVLAHAHRRQSHAQGKWQGWNPQVWQVFLHLLQVVGSTACDWPTLKDCLGVLEFLVVPSTSQLGVESENSKSITDTKSDLKTDVAVKSKKTKQIEVGCCLNGQTNLWPWLSAISGIVASAPWRKGKSEENEATVNEFLRLLSKLLEQVGTGRCPPPSRVCDSDNFGLASVTEEIPRAANRIVEVWSANAKANAGPGDVDLVALYNKCSTDTKNVSNSGRDGIWVQIIVIFASYFCDKKPLVRHNATGYLESALLALEWSPSVTSWQVVFEYILLPLVSRARACNHIPTHFNALWLKIVGVLAKDIQGSGELQETLCEKFKNVMMVLIADNIFQKVSERSGQDVLALTWTVIDSCAPSVKQEIQELLGINNAESVLVETNRASTGLANTSPNPGSNSIGHTVPMINNPSQSSAHTKTTASSGSTPNSYNLTTSPTATTQISTQSTSFKNIPQDKVANKELSTSSQDKEFVQHEVSSTYISATIKEEE